MTPQISAHSERSVLDTSIQQTRHGSNMPDLRLLGYRANGKPFYLIQGGSGEEDGQQQNPPAGGDGSGQQNTPPPPPAPSGDSDKGFPDETPLAEMTPEQREAYWKFQARKHERRWQSFSDYEAIKAERDQLRAATLTAEEKAVEDARADGANTARAELRDVVLRAHAIAEATSLGFHDPTDVMTVAQDALKGVSIDDNWNVDRDALKAALAGVVEKKKYLIKNGVTLPPDLGQGNPPPPAGRMTGKDIRERFLS